MTFDNKTFSTAELTESIIDQDWIDAGVTPEQLRQSKLLTQIEIRLVAEGRSAEDFYAECENSSPTKIIEKYSYKLSEKKNPTSSVSSETSKLYLSFEGLKPGNPPTAYLRANNPNSTVKLPKDTLAFPVPEALLHRFRSLKEGQPVSIRMLVTQTEQGTEVSIIEINLEQKHYPTFDKSFQR